MKRYTSLVAASLLLAAFAPFQTHGAANTWNNGLNNFIWDNTTPGNWTSPTTWADGNDAILNGLGADHSGLGTTVTLGNPVTAHHLTVTGTNYNIIGNSYPLTLAGTTPTITASASSNTFGAAIAGTNGLTFQGGTNVLLGDLLPAGNTYTGGTYVRSGTLILRVAGVSTSGSAYGVDNLEAIDPGATVQIGTENDGINNVRPADGQLLRGNNLGRLNLTGGTFDNNGDDNGINYPCPEGSGTIVNSSPYKRAVMKLQGGNAGKTYTFTGQIKDGGPNVTTSQGVAYQQNIDMNGSGPYTLVLGGSNSFTGFLRLNSGGNGNKIIVTPGGTLGYPAPINCPARQILMNSGTIDLNGTSQKVGYVYTGNNTDSIITNSAFGTVSTLTVCFNTTNLVAFNGAATPRGIRGGLLDDPTTGGTLAVVKEGVAIQPIGTYAADTGSALPNNYHGATTVNNGILEVLSTSGLSPNSAYRLNTTQGILQLDFAGTANVRQLWINGVQQPNGVYGSGSTTAITGSGTLTVTGADFNTWNNGSSNFTWDFSSANWTSPTVWADGVDAIFGATGTGTVNQAAAITAHNLKFNAAGYVVNGGGYPLTLAGASPTITANNDVTIGTGISGTNGLIVQGTTKAITLTGDPGISANNYTGGTYVRSGTLVLQAGSANSSGTAYAVDSIEALDTGATVKMGSTFNGTSWSGPARDQIAALATGSKLIMTGGTLDLHNDPKNQRIPVPNGSGLIINTGPDVQAGVLMVADGQNHTFSGVIADGNGGNLIGGNSGQGPGYQIGIVQFSNSKNGGGGVLTLSGANTYSGSTRIDQGASIKLAGNGTIGFPTPNGLTGPLRIYGSADPTRGYLDLNGHNQTIALMQNGNADGKVFNSGVGTVSTLTFGYGNEQVARTASFQFMDNQGTGGLLALRKIGTNCIQTLSGVNTYSGDTTVSEGILALSTTTAVSPNSAFRLSTSATLRLTYSDTANVRQLWIDGVQKPNGVYGAGTPGIDPASTGSLTVTGFAAATLGLSQSGNTLAFSWPGVYKLQTKTNDIIGPWFDYPSGGTSPVNVTVDHTKGSVFFRLSSY